MKEKVQDKELFFSIELESKTSLKNLNLANGSDNSALIEGTIGSLMNASFVEGEILEIAGKKGTLRINLNPSELKTTANSSLAEEQGAVQENKAGEVK